MSRKPPVCLSIAGLDPSGGAGLIADIQVFAAFGCFGTGVATSITFQNTSGVSGALHQNAESVRRQAEAVFLDYEVAVVKTGMLPTSDVVREVARLVREFRIPQLVVDPVISSTSGFELIEPDAVEALGELISLATIVTPNLSEASQLSGIGIETEDDLVRAAGVIRSTGVRNVLIKGGHLTPEQQFKGDRRAVDRLFRCDGEEVFEIELIDSSSTHGTGCVLASAISAGLAHGHSVSEAVRAAKAYVSRAIEASPGIGRGNGPLGYFAGVKMLGD